MGKKMMWIVKRMLEPSTWAGIGLLSHSLPAVIATPMNPLAWAGLLGSVVAILKSEGGNA